MGGRVIALVAVGSGLVAAAAWAQTGPVVSGPEAAVGTRADFPPVRWPAATRAGPVIVEFLV